MCIGKRTDGSSTNLRSHRKLEILFKLSKLSNCSALSELKIHFNALFINPPSQQLSCGTVRHISTWISYRQSLKLNVCYAVCRRRQSDLLLLPLLLLLLVTDTKYMHIYTIRRSFYALAIKLQKQQQQQREEKLEHCLIDIWLTKRWRNW